MIAFNVVVLPAPLRPRSVTTSPAEIVNSTPCSACDSPYQAWRSRTASNGSAMTGPDIGFAHLGVRLHLRIGALSEDLAAGEHGVGVQEIGDHREIMLDHEHAPPLGHALDEPGDALDILAPEACHRLVEEQHLGIECERGGDLERALSSIGKLGRQEIAMIGEPDLVQELVGAGIQAIETAFRAPEAEGEAEGALQGRS